MKCAVDVLSFLLGGRGAKASGLPAEANPREKCEDDDVHSRTSTKLSSSWDDRGPSCSGTGSVGDSSSCGLSPMSAGSSHNGSRSQLLPAYPSEAEIAAEEQRARPAAAGPWPGAACGGWALGDFRVVKTVGVGFLGSVRLVKLASGGDTTPLALKVMEKSVVVKKKQAAHVMQEKQLLSQVDHPFIIKLLAAFQDTARLYMVMEFVNGGELFAAVRGGKKFRNDAAKFYIAEVTLALGHCHSHNIAYRDLKLENILIDSQGHVKLIDFGFAKLITTRAYTQCGTPDYMAPEIITIQGHDTRVDWWAMGVLTYELLTGRTPFKGASFREVCKDVLSRQLKYPSYFTREARAMVDQLLIKNKTFRLGSGVNGTEDVKNHPWFASVDWDMVLGKQCAPPFLPKVKSSSDTTNFDDYPEVDISCHVPGPTASDQQLFEGF